MLWLLQSNGHISVTGDIYQDRLNRLESDKESLVLQVMFIILVQYLGWLYNLC